VASTVWRQSTQALLVRGQFESTLPKIAEPKYLNLNLLRRVAMWMKPEYTEMRFGFEVTMYIANR